MNTQKPMKEETEKVTLSIMDIFQTIQGEGPFIGHPAIFVRLAGCNLQCPMCDTDYTVGVYSVTPRDMLHLAFVAGDAKLMVITGGEPFRQARMLVHFVRMALLAGYKVQFETNGIIWNDRVREIMDNPLVHTVCSPKTNTVHSEVAKRVDYWKYVGSRNNLSWSDGLPVTGLGYKRVGIYRHSGITADKIYLSVMDEFDRDINRANMEAVKESCLKHGYIFTPQLHKTIGVK